MPLPVRIARALRSRRAAVLLIAGLGVWSVVASSVPGWGTSFSSPWFRALSLWLFAATAACAWERSVRALHWRRLLAARQPVTSPLTLAEAQQRLKALGLRVTAHGDSLTATRRVPAAALWASPVFHWSLAAGIALAVAASMVSASDGRILFVGTPVRIDVGGREAVLTLAEARPDLMMGGVDRGQAPRLSVAVKGGDTAAGWAYPNHPLRASGLTVHGVESGPAVRIEVTGADGSKVATDEPLHASGASSTSYSAEVGIVGGPVLRIEQVAGHRIRVSATGASAGGGSVIGQGESAEIAGGFEVRFVRPTTWASVTVVRDPTMWWLGLAGAVACVTAGVALLYPQRSVAVEEAETGCVYRIRSSRIDPAWGSRVRRALEDEVRSD